MRTRRSKESNWGRMRKDQQKWGLESGGEERQRSCFPTMKVGSNSAHNCE